MEKKLTSGVRDLANGTGDKFQSTLPHGERHEASRLLEQAHSKLNEVLAIVNDEDAFKISHLQTYLINLAGVF